VSGSGKSSLLSLLLRYFEPSSGRILLDGVDIRSLDPRWLKAQIGIVTQVGQSHQTLSHFSSTMYHAEATVEETGQA
jgi:ABC-type multidrug transport system fused ATPase/permease subunit